MAVSRKPAVAGMFYPSDKDELMTQIKTLLDISQPREIPENIIGLVSPHAGYIYSGSTAAYAYNTIKNKNYKTVIILSPSHREYFYGACIYSGDAYETPLGAVEIDKEMAIKLTAGSKYLFTGTKGHDDEHAVEVQIPFLQMVLTNFKIVPIVMGDQAPEVIKETAKQIASAADDNTLIVASSDLSHFNSKAEAAKLDALVEKRIIDFNFTQLQNDVENNRCEACGAGPIVAMMNAAEILGKNHSIILNRTDSGDTSGDNSRVVGYLSAAIYGK
ncbi:MAG: AmmeMemoRadiSam system protein B [Ignavibacteriaceae bacterium]|nr:AmmeMemoRadiSam system protein B [Ignavibacteriaceae bacterium]